MLFPPHTHTHTPACSFNLAFSRGACYHLQSAIRSIKRRRERKLGWSAEPRMLCRGAEPCLSAQLHPACTQLLQMSRAPQSSRCSASELPLLLLRSSVYAVEAGGKNCRMSLPLTSPSWLRSHWQLGRCSIQTETSGPAGGWFGEVTDSGQHGKPMRAATLSSCIVSLPITKPFDEPRGAGQKAASTSFQQINFSVGCDPISGAQQQHPKCLTPGHGPSELFSHQPSPGQGNGLKLVSRHVSAAKHHSYFSLLWEIPHTPCSQQHFPPLLRTASPTKVDLPLSIFCSKAASSAWLWSHQSTLRELMGNLLPCP